MEDKLNAESKRDDLQKEIQAQDEIIAKRIQSKLQRERTPEMKELLVQMEVMEKANEETKMRLSEEIEKHDKLLAGLLEVIEKLSIK